MKFLIDTVSVASVPSVGGIAMVSALGIFGGHPFVALLGYCIGSLIAVKIMKRTQLAYDSIHKR
jgi:hypothetical protein